MTDITQPSPILQDQTPPQRGRRRRKPRALRGLLTGFAGGSALLLVVLGTVALVGSYGYFQLSGLILPGVSVEGIPLGGLTEAQAARAIAQRWPAERAITLSYGEQRWVVPASDLGITLDAAATAQRAQGVGRNRDALSETLTLVDSTINGTEVVPVTRVDVETARAGLAEWAEIVNVPPQEASLRLEGGQIVTAPGRVGTALDVEATLTTLTARPGEILTGGTLPLTVVQVAPREQAVSAVLSEAEQLLAADLTVQAYDPITDEHIQWTASREDIATWLLITNDAGGPSIEVDAQRLAAYLNERNASLGGGRGFDVEGSTATVEAALRGSTRAVTLPVTHPATTYTVQPGDSLSSIGWDTGMPAWRIVEANPGMTLNSRLSVGETLTIPSPDVLLPLPVVDNKRIVVSLRQQRLWAYQDGAVIYEYVISTGIDRSPTQPGIFQVQTHEPLAYAGLWDLTMPNFLGIYEAWPGFMNGFHGLPTLSNGQILWADVLGRPASYGCIILDLDAAETLYNWAEDGVVVEIVA